MPRKFDELKTTEYFGNGPQSLTVMGSLKETPKKYSKLNTIRIGINISIGLLFNLLIKFTTDLTNEYLGVFKTLSYSASKNTNKILPSKW